MFAALGAVLGLTGLALLVFEFRRGPKTLTSNNVTLETLTSEDFIPVDGKLRSAGKAKRARPSGRSRG
jgi:hypothetical protein